MATDHNGRDPEAISTALFPSKSLLEPRSSNALRQCCDSCLVQLCCGQFQALSEFPACQMHVHHGCVHAAVPGEGRDLMHIPARAGEIGQTHVAKSMGGKAS